MMPTPPACRVRADEWEARVGRIGVITLDAGDRLNALTLGTARTMLQQLTQWKYDERIAVVVLHAASEKAFCAGGDLREMYAAQKAMAPDGASARVQASEHIKAFLQWEYRLDYELHTYAKPVLCWGHGLVMGGGLGLMVGCSHRVVTEFSQLSMPEIAIGHFPDVAGSWFLNRMPGRTGLFAGLTGAVVHPGDVVFAKLADYVVPQVRKEAIFDQLRAQSWSSPRERNDELLGRVLRAASAECEPGERPLHEHCDLVTELCSRETVPDIVAAITALRDSNDPWLRDAASRLASGYPGSAWLVHALLKRTAHLSLAQVFSIEYAVAIRSVEYGQFMEGIRALIIEKDRRPHWDRKIDEIDDAWVDDAFFKPLPAAENPLLGLGDGPPLPPAKTWA